MFVAHFPSWQELYVWSYILVRSRNKQADKNDILPTSEDISVLSQIPVIIYST